MLKKNLRTVFLAIGSVAITIATMDFVALPSYNTLWREVANSGHIPLFGLLSLVFLRLSVVFFKLRFAKWYFHYLISLGTVTTIGVLSELAQMRGPRDADPFDLLRDIVGAIVFLSLASTIPPRILSWTLTDWSQKAKGWIRLTAFLLLVIALSPLIYWSAAFYNRSRQLPLICRFESIWEMAFVGTDSGQLECVNPPTGWIPSLKGAEENNRVGKYTFGHAKYSGFHIKEPYPDFSAYKTLSFELFSELDTTFSLIVRIEDRYHNNRYDDRLNLQVLIRPGMNFIEIPCSKIRLAPINREMDMTAIAAISVFAAEPAEAFSIFVDNISLR